MILSRDEISILDRMLGKAYTVVNNTDYDCYIMSTPGEYVMNDDGFCKKTDGDENKVTFSRVTAKRIIKVFHYFLMELDDEAGVWYQGEMLGKDTLYALGGCDSLEEAIEML